MVAVEFPAGQAPDTALASWSIAACLTDDSPAPTPMYRGDAHRARGIGESHVERERVAYRRICILRGSKSITMVPQLPLG